MSCCAVVWMFVRRLASLNVCAFVIVIMLGECRDAVFSFRPSVWLQCRVTLIPLISARAQRGEGGRWRFRRVTSSLRSVHPLIWDTHLCLDVFFFCLCVTVFVSVFSVFLWLLHSLVFALFSNSESHAESHILLIIFYYYYYYYYPNPSIQSTWTHPVSCAHVHQ